MKEIILDLTKNEIVLEIQEDCIVKCAYKGDKNSEVSSNVTVKIIQPKIKCDIDIRSVLYDTARLNLDCKIVIPKGVKYVDAYLNIKVLNLSDSALANIIPGLEIMENDVKCGHALTIGKPDEKQVQYLASRGIPRSEAFNLIIQGFLK